MIPLSGPAQLDFATGLETKVMLMRQAAYPLWHTAVLGNFVYLAGYSLTAPISGISTQLYSANVQEITSYSLGNITGSGNFPSVSVSGTQDTVLSSPIIGLDPTTGPIPWVYIPTNLASATAIVTTTVAPGQSANFRVAYDIWVGPGEVDGRTTANSTAWSATNLGHSMQITDFGGLTTGGIWIRPTMVMFDTAVATGAMSNLALYIAVSNAATIAYVPSTSNSGIINAGGTNTLRCLVPYVMPTDFNTTSLPWEATRVTAVAASFTNMTAVLNKSGSILCGRVNPTVKSPYAVTSADLKTLNPAEKAFLSMERGAYTFCPPSTDLVDFLDYSQRVGSAITGPSNLPVVRLDNTALVNVLIFKPTSADEQMAATVYWHLEFRNNSALFPIALSEATLESLHRAQISVLRGGLFFNSPHPPSQRIKDKKKPKPKPEPKAVKPKPATPPKVVTPKPNKQQPPAPSAKGSGISKK